jgi:Fe-S-cluster containining protein
VPEHEAALTLANHDPEECYLCLLQEEVRNTCRCGLCCRRLLIEVGLADAEREPRIKERGSPLYTPPELTASGQRELEGYLLNGPDVACVFLDQATNACTIYASRPLTCRLFDCDGDGREQLLTLGLLPRAENREEGEEVP